jgi:hypothetical protein
MNEPRLENIDDYHTLSGEKKRIVWAVVFATLIIGVIYTSAKLAYNEVDDQLPQSEISQGYVPSK